MAIYRCRRCHHEQDQPWEGVCPGCWGLYRWSKVGADSEEQKKRSTFAKAAEYKVDYIPTTLGGFDKVIGGGLVPGSAILLGGQHGAGKSTLLCMVADAVAKAKGSTLYASSEQGVKGVLSIAHRVGAVNDDVEVLGNQDNIERAIEHAKQTKPFLTIFDSLQKFSSPTSGGSPGSIAQEMAVCTAIINYCRETNRCAIIVNQMSKAGEMKGSTEASHAVDTVVILGYPKEDDVEAPRESLIRVLLIDKNRDGSERAKSYWRMTEAGLLEEVAPRNPEEKEGRRRSRFKYRPLELVEDEKEG
jgi:DNA repair protein RadA/Sms